MFLAEAIGSFLYFSNVCGVVYNSDKRKELVPLAAIIGFGLFLGLMVTAPLSGGSLNPAIGLVLAIYQHFRLKVPMHQLWVHTLAPLSAACAAGIFSLFI